MKGPAELSQLLQISQATYDHAQRGFARIVAREKELRQALTRLTEMEQRGRTISEHSHPIKIAGADVLWQSWLGRSRTELNMQLARVLAQKEFEQKKVRRAFGKVVALEELIRQEQTKSRRIKSRSALQAAIDVSVNTNTW